MWVKRGLLCRPYRALSTTPKNDLLLYRPSGAWMLLIFDFYDYAAPTELGYCWLLNSMILSPLRGLGVDGHSVLLLLRPYRAWMPLVILFYCYFAPPGLGSRWSFGAIAMSSLRGLQLPFSVSFIKPMPGFCEIQSQLRRSEIIIELFMNQLPAP